MLTECVFLEVFFFLSRTFASLMKQPEVPAMFPIH